MQSNEWVVQQDKRRYLAFKAFANSEYYIEQWSQLIEKGRGKTSFNLAATLFGTMWCFYRKLYWLGVSVFLSSVVIVTVAKFVAITYATNPINLGLHPLLVIVVFVRIPLGFMANYLYFKHARHFVERLLSESTVESVQIKAARRGGVSTSSAIFVAALNVIMRFVLHA